MKRVVEVERVETDTPVDVGEVAVNEVGTDIHPRRGVSGDMDQVLALLERLSTTAPVDAAATMQNFPTPDPTSSTRVSGVGASNAAARSATRTGVQKTEESARSRGG